MFLIIYNHTIFYGSFSMQFFHKTLKIQCLHMSYIFYTALFFRSVFSEFNFHVLFFVRHEKQAQKKDCIHKEYSLLWLQIKPDISVLQREANPVCG